MARYTDKLEYIPPLIVAHFKACYVELATNKRQTDYLAIGLRCTPDQPFRFREIKGFSGSCFIMTTPVVGTPQNFLNW
jgi:hypothetical protein